MAKWNLPTLEMTIQMIDYPSPRLVERPTLFDLDVPKRETTPMNEPTKL